jgi:hypothetical protein
MRPRCQLSWRLEIQQSQTGLDMAQTSLELWQRLGKIFGQKEYTSRESSVHSYRHESARVVSFACSYWRINLIKSRNFPSTPPVHAARVIYLSSASNSGLGPQNIVHRVCPRQTSILPTRRLSSSFSKKLAKNL